MTLPRFAAMASLTSFSSETFASIIWEKTLFDLEEGVKGQI